MGQRPDFELGVGKHHHRYSLEDIFGVEGLQTGAQMRSIEGVSKTALSDEILNWCEHAD